MKNYRHLSMLFAATLILLCIQTGQSFAATSSQTTATVVIVPTTTSISVHPNSGPGGTQATVTGSNFPPNQKISLIFVDARSHSHTLGHVNSDSRGAFTIQVTIPHAAAPGIATISAQHNDKTLASTTFTVLFPTITVNPTSGVGGAQVIVMDSGFALNGEVDIFIGKDITHHLMHIGEVTTDGTGAFIKRVEIPSEISVGNYFISAREDVNREVFAAVPFTVLPTITATTLSSHNPSTFSQLVMFTARVLPAPDGGTVTFYDGTTALGSSHVGETGRATLSTSALSVGTHIITSIYSGDSNFVSSTSGMLIQTVMMVSHK